MHNTQLKRKESGEYVITYYPSEKPNVEDSKFEIYFEDESNIVDADLYEEHLKAWQQSQIEVPVHESQWEKFIAMAFNISWDLEPKLTFQMKKKLADGISIPSERVEVRHCGDGNGCMSNNLEVGCNETGCQMACGFAFLKSEVKEESQSELLNNWFGWIEKRIDPKINRYDKEYIKTGMLEFAKEYAQSQQVIPKVECKTCVICEKENRMEPMVFCRKCLLDAQNKP